MSTFVGDMEALSVLKAEHSALMSEVYQFDRQLTFLESSGPMKGMRILKELADSSRRIREDLQQHTGKEEKWLFPVLETRLGKDRELVDVMRHEHGKLIESLASLMAELDRMVNEHDTKRTWTLVSHLQGLKGCLNEHLSKEERLLFWLAELRLSWLDQRKVASGIQAADEKMLRLQP